MTATAATAITPDCDAIVRVVQLYVDGFTQCDSAKLQEAFHESAWIFFTDAEGTLHQELIATRIPRWAVPTQRNIAGRIISVTQAGDVAVVLLGFDNVDDLANSWVDVHSLLRIDGVWKIMNKTATHSSRGAWAGVR